MTFVKIGFVHPCTDTRTIFTVIADQYLTTFLHTLSVVSALLLYNTTKTAPSKEGFCHEKWFSNGYLK